MILRSRYVIEKRGADGLSWATQAVVTGVVVGGVSVSQRRPSLIVGQCVGV